MLTLQRQAGNAATRTLMRWTPDAPGETAAGMSLMSPGEATTLSEPGAEEGGYCEAAFLSPGDAARIQYARTTLARVAPLPAEDERVLQQLIPATPILELIAERDRELAEIERIETRLRQLDERVRAERSREEEAARYGPLPGGVPWSAEMFAEAAAETEAIAGELDQHQQRAGSLNDAIGRALGELGIESERELRSLVEARFPELFLKRGRQIALTMLNENKRLVEDEAARFGIPLGRGQRVCYVPARRAGHQQAADPDQGIRSAASELATLARALEQKRERAQRLDTEIRQSGEQIEVERGREEDVRRYGPLPGGVPWSPEMFTEAEHSLELRQAELARIHEEIPAAEAALKSRLDELGLAYPVLFRISDYARLARASDEELRDIVGSELSEIWSNIEDTKENIRDGDLKVWNLPQVMEMTMQDLDLTSDSPLIAAVMRKAREEETDEAIWNIAIAAIGLTAAIIAALPSAGTSLTVAGTVVAVGVGGYQLSESVSSFLAESAASDVSLDPVLADISANDPDLLPVALDLVGLGLDAFDVVRCIGLIGDAVRAARVGDTGLPELRAVLRSVPEIGEQGARRVMATVTREAEIQASVVRVIEAIGTSFHRVDLEDVVAEIRRLGDEAVNRALDDFEATGRIKPLTPDALEEVFGADEAARLITEERMLRADGFYDPSNGFIFVKEGAKDSVALNLLHETVHYLQDTYRPSMELFMQEFEAYAAMRHYAQRLVADGVDPAVAFPKWRDLPDWTDDDIYRHIAEQYPHLTPPANIDLEGAVWNALTELGRVESGAAGAAAATTRQAIGPPLPSTPATRAQALVEELPKLSASERSVAGLTEIFTRTGSGGRGVSPREGMAVGVHTRGHAAELKTILHLHARPEVVRIEVVPPSTSGRSADLIVHVRQADGTVVPQRVEIATLTGARRGYRERGELGRVEATTVNQIVGAIRSKTVRPGAGKLSQLVVPMEGVEAGGTLVVHVPRGGPDAIANVEAAMQRLAGDLGDADYLHAIEFFLPGGQRVRYVRGADGTYVGTSPL
ncbi:MAG TPA: hypothetical protein VK919_00105 [Solirubrobacterales bacterium]|nr:hypothetical protein [Solirubrobacterales bacterium]